MSITVAAPINPRQLKHIRVILADTDFAAQVKKCEFKKGGGATQVWNGGTPAAQYVDKAPDEHSVDLTIIADWEEDESLCNFLYDNDGEKATLQYEPVAGGKIYFEAEITITAPPPPGSVGEWAEVTQTMPSTKAERKTRPVTP